MSTFGAFLIRDYFDVKWEMNVAISFWLEALYQITASADISRSDWFGDNAMALGEGFGSAVALERLLAAAMEDRS